MSDLKAALRVFKDYQRAGINFYDITTLLKSAEHRRTALARFSNLFSHLQGDKVVGIETRGFLFAPTIARPIGAEFVPVCRAGKLPAKAKPESCELEYGFAEMEIHRDAIHCEVEAFLIIDNVLATGGTDRAAAQLVETLGGRVVGYECVL
jgi:adenine phosphoribosyltransferase